MRLEGHPIEILSIERAKSADEATKGNPVCVFTFRDHPEKGGLERHVLMITQDQCVRIRDSMDDFLNDHDSWLYVPKAQQQEMRMK
jgi:hypothetical protein